MSKIFPFVVTKATAEDYSEAVSQGDVKHMWLTALAVLNICPTVLLERLPTELCSTFFTLGCQKSWCSDAWCQQREHHQPASGCCLRSSWPALHGPLHCYFCGGVSQLAPRAGGALQITARERRYLCHCQFAFQTPLVLIISLFSPFFSFARCKKEFHAYSVLKVTSQVQM